MTAAECLKSDDPKAVGAFYEELRSKGRLGERAFQLLRAHRNVSRLRHYDDPKYMKFIEGRATFALQELMDFAGIEKGDDSVRRIVIVVPEFDGQKAESLDFVTFKRDKAGEWKST